MHLMQLSQQDETGLTRKENAFAAKVFSSQSFLHASMNIM
jgi:hypothetical protein